MKADLTRNSFDPIKHFARVLMQQGRVQLDADWNEQAAILLHLLRRLAADQFDPAFPARLGGGFRILPLMTTTQPNGLNLDFGIEPGRFYVDGILCELEATPVRVLTRLRYPDKRGPVDRRRDFFCEKSVLETVG